MGGSGSGRKPTKREMTEAQQSLAARHFADAIRMARSAKKHWPAWADDIESAAVLGMVESAFRYTPDRREKFMTFAHRRIRGEIYDAVAGERRWRDNLKKLIAMGA